MFAMLFATALASNSALTAAPCRVGQTGAASICGTLRVFEDRTAHAGRTIGIRFIVIRAKHPSQHAITFNPGGPGASATAMAPDFADATAGAIAALRDRYDIVLVDNRGSGGSAPQQCDFAPASHPERYFSHLWPDELVRACRQRLSLHANLSLYTTDLAADDLDDVRAALGYPELVLFGGSYGTEFYLDYARRHPDHVESIVLEGVVPPHYYILPLPMARGAQTAIENLERACKQDRTCASHFPQFAAHFAAVLRRFDRGPVRMDITNPATHLPQPVRLTKEVLAEAIRHELYFPRGAAYIPVTIERAYHGDYRPLAEMVNQMALLFASVVSNGLNLSVSCAEDLPFVTEAGVTASSAGTFEGDARVRAQQRACKLWDVLAAPAAYQDPVHSNAPVLMISGSDDPASPPQYGSAALAFLPHGRQMIVPGATHDSDMPACVDAAIVAFVRARSAAGLDLNHCAATYSRPSFVTLAYDEAAPGENNVRRAHRRLSVDAGRIENVSDAAVKELASGLAQLGGLHAVNRISRADFSG